MLNLIDGCYDIPLAIWSVVTLGFLVGKSQPDAESVAWLLVQASLTPGWTATLTMLIPNNIDFELLRAI